MPGPAAPTKQGEEKHPGGAPTKLTPEVCAEFTRLLAAGNYFVTCCRYLGIHETTGYNWQNWGREGIDAPGDWADAFREFFKSTERASAQAEIQAVAEVQLAGKPHGKRYGKVLNPETKEETWEELEPGQWQATMTFLERRFSDRWSRKERLGVGQDPTAGPVQTENKHSGTLDLTGAAEVLGILAASGALQPEAADAPDSEVVGLDTAPAAP